MALTFFLATPVGAQWATTPPPVDSPYWWTLTDSISPSELRASLQDRDAHRERFRAAAEDGRLRGTVSEQQIHEVEIYLDGGSHPELVPLYLAFESFAARFDYLPGWQKTSAALLAEHGVTSEGAERIVRLAGLYNEKRDEMKAEVASPVAELMEMLAPLGRELGNERLQAMLVAGDVAGLAELTGRDAATIGRLHAAWRRQPIVEAALPILVELRESLSPADWNAFRKLLFLEVAPKISAVDYISESGR